MCISILPSADFWITTPFYLKAKCSTASFARNTDPAKHICRALWVLVREGTFLVGVNFLQLPFLKVRIKRVRMLAITNQNVTPEEKSLLHKISHFILIGKFQQEKWKMLNLISWTQTFFSYKQENKPSCLQNKCNYFLTSSNLVISRVIHLLEEKKNITLNLHQSQKSTIYVKESLR